MELAFSPYWDDSPYRTVSIVRIESWEGLLICKTTPRHDGLFLPRGIETTIGNGRGALTTWCRAVRPLKGGDRGLPDEGMGVQGGPAFETMSVGDLIVISNAGVLEIDRGPDGYSRTHQD